MSKMPRPKDRRRLPGTLRRKALRPPLEEGYRALAGEAKRLTKEFSALDVESLAILSDKDLMTKIRQGIREAKQAKVIPWEHVKRKVAHS